MPAPPVASHMQRAIRLALRGVRRNDGGPFGAVIVRGEEIVGQGANQVLSKNDPTAHAEIVAIRTACRRTRTFKLDGCVLYTTCEPCPMCLAAIYWARIDHVYYACDRNDAARAGFDDAFFYAELEAPPAGRRLPLEPFLRDDALVTFQAWLAKTDRIAY